jgi:hypothetical protein
MTTKKFTLSLILALLLSLTIIGIVLAGTTLEFGLVEGNPPVGEVNFFAWLDKPANILPAGMPQYILTEENYNSDLGEGGYQEFDGLRYWLLQVENFAPMTPAVNDKVNMIFGGLGASSGKLWFFDFNWDQLDTSTFHGTVPLSTQNEACPVITNMSYDGSTKNVTFDHLPDSTYHIYRSTQPSGAPNQLSSWPL